MSDHFEKLSSTKTHFPMHRVGHYHSNKIALNLMNHSPSQSHIASLCGCPRAIEILMPTLAPDLQRLWPMLFARYIAAKSTNSCF